jgi:DDB1- and CUL4-associated factor 6
MKSTLDDRLWRRESGETSKYNSYKGLYGDQKWVDDLDIVNELGGHNGCVNALR